MTPRLIFSVGVISPLSIENSRGREIDRFTRSKSDNSRVRVDCITLHTLYKVRIVGKFFSGALDRHTIGLHRFLQRIPIGHDQGSDLFAA